ncbi:MAG: hypothetical protein K8T91_13790 [Planctomycetes bacterium]|nr:hypothetical protein [Planctomycetota bacterium]
MSSLRIKFACPAGHKLRARPDKAGSKTLCPACGAEVVVPQSADSEPAAPLNAEMPVAPPQPAGTLPVEIPSPPLEPINDGPIAAEETLTTETAAAGKDVEAPRPAIKRPPLAPSSKPAKETVEDPATANREQTAASPPPLPALLPNKSPPLPVASNASPAVAPPPLPSQNPATTAATPPPLPSAPKQEAAPSPAPSQPPPLRVAGMVDKTKASITTLKTNAKPPMPMAPSAVQGYRPDHDTLLSVYRLGLTLSIITLFQILPALWHALYPSAPYFTLSGAPAWAQIVLMLCLLQVVYIVWMVSLPDWCTVWILMLIYGAVSAVYGFAFAASLLTPRTEEMLLGLDIVRRPTPWWCAGMVLLTFLAAFLCGRTSSRWHRTYLARAIGQ